MHPSRWCRRLPLPVFLPLILILLLLLSISNAAPSTDPLYIPDSMLKRYPNLQQTLSAAVNKAEQCAQFLPPSFISIDGLSAKGDVMGPCLAEKGTLCAKEACITTVIHQTWREAAVPLEFSDYVNSWERYNHDWLHLIWDDASLEDLVRHAFPELLALYKYYPYPVMRADAARILLVYYYGGVYADFDYELSGPIDALLRLSKSVGYLGHPSGASPAFFLGAPRSKFLAFAISRLNTSFEEHSRSMWSYRRILDTNGPNFIRECLRNMPGQVCYFPMRSFAPCDTCGRCHVGIAHLGNHHLSGVWHGDAPLSSWLSELWQCDRAKVIAVLLLIPPALWWLRRKIRPSQCPHERHDSCKPNCERCHV